MRRWPGCIRLTDMRGDERVQDGMFSYVSLEQRVPSDHPLREVRRVTDTVLRQAEPGVGRAVRGLWAAVDCAGVHSASAAVAGILFHPLRASAGRADRLQPAISLVCGPGHG
jgi:hypothetical protein